MACVPASRTPEGEPATCPICGETFDIEPSFPSGDATCPRCGCLIWVAERPRPLIGLKTAFDRVGVTLAEIMNELQTRAARGRAQAEAQMTLAEIMNELEALRSRIESVREVRRRRVFRRLLDGLRSIFVATIGRRRTRPAVIETPGVWDPWIDGP
jgi:hypothetical protein